MKNIIYKITNILLLFLLLYSVESYSQITAIHFNAEWNKNNDVEWFDKLKECEKKSLFIEKEGIQAALEDQLELEGITANSSGALNATARFLGAMRGAVTDPIVLGSMALNFDPKMGLAKLMLREAIVGGVSEGVVQERVQKWYKELGLDYLRNHPDPDQSRFEVPAQNIVDEFDDIIPQFTAERNFSELNTEFTKLRRAAAEGQPVVWTDVTNALKTAERNRVKRVNFEGSLREKKPGDLDFARERSINELIGYIRDNTGHMGFARSISPNMKTVDFGRGARAGHLGNMLKRLFEMFGEVPADQLSRNPYFRTKYNREVSRRLAYFMDDKGNVNISQNKLFEIEEDARNFAIGETRDLLYDLAEETRISEMLTHIAPFYNAWQEVLGRWAHLATQNPYFVAKAAELYTSEWDADFLGIEQVTTYEQVEIGKKEQELGRKLTDEEKEE